MDQHQAWTLMAVSLGAFIVPLLCRLIHISAAAGEVLFGIAIGPAVLGLVKSDDILVFLGNLGFIVLMFMAGLEIDFNHVKLKGSRAVLISLGVVIISFILAFSLIPLLKWPVFLGLFLASLSLGLPVSILKETRTTSSPAGQAAMVTGSLGEFLTIIVFTILTVTYQAGFGLELVPKMLKLAALFASAVLILRAFMLFVWWKPEIFNRLAETGDPQEIGMRLAMFIMLFFVGLASLFDVKLVLGAFIGGAVLAFTFRETSAIEEKLSNLGFGFLVPIFFIQVGVAFDPSSLTLKSVVTIVPILVITVAAVKIIPLMLLTRTGLSPREALLTGILLSCPLTLMIAIAELGYKMHIVDSELYAVLLLISLILALIMPLAYKLIIRRTHQ